MAQTGPIQSSNSGYAAGVSSKTQAFGTNVLSGTVLLVGVSYFAATSITVSSITDTKGNTYTRIGTTSGVMSPGFNDNIQTVALYYAISSSPGANTVTAALSGAATLAVFVGEYGFTASPGTSVSVSAKAIPWTTAANPSLPITTTHSVDSPAVITGLSAGQTLVLGATGLVLGRASALPTLRGTGLTAGGQTQTVVFPAGTVAGDLAILCCGNAKIIEQPVGADIKWTPQDNLPVAPGPNFTGAVFSKVLTAGDIAVGSILVSGGAFSTQSIIGIATFVGNPGIKEVVVVNNGAAGAATVSVATASVLTSDTLLIFGSNNTASANTCNIGASQQAVNDARASGCLYFRTPAAAGVNTATLSYGASGTGNYQVIVVLSTETGVNANGTSNKFGVAIPAGQGGPQDYLTNTSTGYYYGTGPSVAVAWNGIRRWGLVGAFTDSSGVVIAPVSIGTSAALKVPAGATQLQLGINDYDDWSDNTGGFTVTVNPVVVDSHSVPIPGYLYGTLSTELTAMQNTPVLNSGTEIVVSFAAGEAGHFRIANPPPGGYQVIAETSITGRAVLGHLTPCFYESGYVQDWTGDLSQTHNFWMGEVVAGFYIPDMGGPSTYMFGSPMHVPQAAKQYTIGTSTEINTAPPNPTKGQLYPTGRN